MKEKKSKVKMVKGGVLNTEKNVSYPLNSTSLHP